MAVDKFPVEAGQILLFARAVGDDNPAYSGEQKDILAPPTFVQSSAQYDQDYPLRPKIGQVWFGSGKTPSGMIPAAEEKKQESAESKPKSDSGGEKKSSGGSAGALHAEQHYTYHQPLKAGDTLVVTHKAGKSWEKESRRAGKLQFSEMITEYRNTAGELVVTARSVGVRTERVISQ